MTDDCQEQSTVLLMASKRKVDEDSKRKEGCDRVLQLLEGVQIITIRALLAHSQCTIKICPGSWSMRESGCEGGVKCRKQLFIQDECRFLALSQDCTIPYQPGNGSYPKDGRERAAMASLQPL